jgi:hypothetical protein
LFAAILTTGLPISATASRSNGVGRVEGASMPWGLKGQGTIYGGKMSERAREFLNHWLSGHVEFVPETQRLRETVRLVAACREDAIGAGIPPQELRAAADDDLVRKVLTALSESARLKADATSLAEPRPLIPA